MKIRNGFVSNSSSSSFIVKFPKDLKSIKELQTILFGNRKTYSAPYGDESYPTLQLAKTIWEDIKDQKKNNFEKAVELVRQGWLPDGPNWNDFKSDYDALDREREIFAEKKIKEFFNTRKTKLKKIDGQEIDEVFYIFHYGDEDGSYFATLEHGDIFSKLEHIRISNH